MYKEHFKQHLTENLIPFWNNLEDTEYGGFYGTVDKDLNIDKNSPKGVILNNRILWFYSNAYRLQKDPVLLQKADHAFHFLYNHCYDADHKGVYWSVAYDGTPLDTTKHTYNQAFAIYALSSYYEISKNQTALDLAYSIYNIIEEKCTDTDGYLETFTQDFKPIENDKLSKNGVMADRTMNTLLHVMEAYTELYRVDASPGVEKSIYRILDLFKDKIYTPVRQRCDVFFDSDYHSLINLTSFGHDIETAWLMDRTCEIISDKSYQQILTQITDTLTTAVYNSAYDFENHGLFNEKENNSTDQQKIWWVQAESVVGFYNAYQKHPETKEYLSAAANTFSFILEKMVDKKSGEWFESIRPDDTINNEKGMAHAWKCPYHNGRMCIEMMQRLAS